MSDQYATSNPTPTIIAPIPVAIRAVFIPLAPLIPALNEVTKALPILPIPLITFLNLLASPPVASSKTAIAPSPASPAFTVSFPRSAAESAASSRDASVFFACLSTPFKAVERSSTDATDFSIPSISNSIFTFSCAIYY